MSMKEVDEQMLNVQKKNSSYSAEGSQQCLDCCLQEGSGPLEGKGLLGGTADHHHPTDVRT